MKLKLCMALMIILGFSLPLGINAKGKPAGTVLLKDANGVEIGRVIGMESVSWPYVLTDQGYRTLFILAFGRVHINTAVYFESTNCTGTAYVPSAKYLGAVFSATPQYDIAYALGGLMYSPSDAQSATVDINTTLDSNLECVPYVYPGYTGYPAYLNNPDITGINNTIYPARLLIE